MLSRKIHRVAIVRGTHGNELAGIYLVKKFQRYPDLVSRHSFETMPLLANPQAFALQRRYVEQDLNRCFLPTELQTPRATSYKASRAKEIYQTLVTNLYQRSRLLRERHRPVPD